MKSRTRKWLLGCGGTFVALIVVAAALILGGVFFLKQSVEDFEQADRSIEEVAERFGPIAAFRAEPGGAISAQRLERFLEVRDEVAPVRAELQKNLVVLSGRDADGERTGGLIATTRAVAGLLGQLAGYVEGWNQSLLQAEIGHGEYYYIYSLAFYSWLEHSPADGPPFKMVSEDGYIFETVEPSDGPAVRAHRDDLTRRTFNRLLLPVLRDQFESLAEHEGDESAGQWRETLAAEIAALEADPRRIPWQDGLPEEIASSLQPYRQRLEASYSEMVNALEAGIARR